LKLNNLELLDSWFILSCYKEANQFYKLVGNKKVIFGGRKNFFDLMKGLITKE
jgi:hypothetical protein